MYGEHISTGFNTSIRFYSELLWISLSHTNFWEIGIIKISLYGFLGIVQNEVIFKKCIMQEEHSLWCVSKEKVKNSNQY